MADREAAREALLSIQEEIKRDLAKERELREHQNTKCIPSSEERTRGQQIEETVSPVRERAARTPRQRSRQSLRQNRLVSVDMGTDAGQQYTIFKEGGPGYTKYIVYTADSSDRKTGGLKQILPPVSLMKRHKSLPPRERRKGGLDMSERLGQDRARGPSSYYYGLSDTELESEQSVRAPGMNGMEPASQSSQRERKAKDAINAELQEMYRREKEHKKLHTRIRQELKIK